MPLSAVRQRAFAAMILGCMAVFLSTGSAASATPYIQLSLSVSPNPVPGNTPVTVSGTATPVGGTFAGVEITLNSGSSGCAPAGCHADTAHTYFDFATLTSKRSFSTLIQAGGPTTYRVAVTLCNPNDCLNVPASVTLKGPTTNAKITYSPAGAIKPGSTLHFTVTGLVNVGPVQADVQTKFMSGLTDPTNVSGAGHWDPAPYDYIDAYVVLDKSASYTFDATVTAQVGSAIRLNLNLFAAPGSGAPDYVRKVSLLVGPTPTPTPHRTSVPIPTRRPPTPAPTKSAPSSGASQPSAAAEPSATSGSSVEPPSLSPEPSAEDSPGAVALTQSGTPTTSPPPALASSTTTPNPTPTAMLVVSATLGISAGALALFVYLRGRLRQP